ncbi:C1 family peptidase [Flavobacterium amniphilum]|uniref:C1 family peptidase n=1 Tax=Flavobacterium amniphilum TaxID=1834035 RepID=UPI002029CB44|nr:C1 family peptidase [Flavobacterium amniphilum]MCL9805765.1 C1 family peptidase [Flavobacterium amniphilum]MCL9806352.1 C1 family peptidase [Flavobacterium amniphilum]
MKTLHFLLLFPFIGICQQGTLTPPEKLFPETIHWTSQSPVKNQGNRNTCSAFGVAAALETLEGVPKDLSEKYLYAVQKTNDYANQKETSTGQLLYYYPNALIKDGVITESELPYNPQATRRWLKDDSEMVKYIIESDIGAITLGTKYKTKARIFLKEYEYLDGITSKNVDYIKSLLKNGIKAIPVSYKLYLPAWKNYRSSTFNTITPDLGYTLFGVTGKPMTFTDAKNLYSDNLTERILSGELKYVQTDSDANQYGYHVVTIIGYDDQGFIIKNSWGTNWRWNGYERVSFDFHKLFGYEGLVLKSVTIKN